MANVLVRCEKGFKEAEVMDADQWNNDKMNAELVAKISGYCHICPYKKHTCNLVVRTLLDMGHTDEFNLNEQGILKLESESTTVQKAITDEAQNNENLCDQTHYTSEISNYVADVVKNRKN